MNPEDHMESEKSEALMLGNDLLSISAYEGISLASIPLLFIAFVLAAIAILQSKPCGYRSIIIGFILYGLAIGMSIFELNWSYDESTFERWKIATASFEFLSYLAICFGVAKNVFAESEHSTVVKSNQ